MLIMVCYFKRIGGINQAEDRVTWPDLLHPHTIALASLREWSVVSAWLRIRAQPWNPCQPHNSASASTCAKQLDVSHRWFTVGKRKAAATRLCRWQRSLVLLRQGHGRQESEFGSKTRWKQLHCVFFIFSLSTCPKTVDSPNTVLQKITGGIFCTQFGQCNDGGAGDKCMILSVFTYSSNPLTQICEKIQLTRWAHRKFPQHFLPLSRQKKHGECLLLLASKFRRSQHVNLKLWLFHVIGVEAVKRSRMCALGFWNSLCFFSSKTARRFWVPTLGLVSTSCGQTAAVTQESGHVW